MMSRNDARGRTHVAQKTLRIRAAIRKSRCEILRRSRPAPASKPAAGSPINRAASKRRRADDLPQRRSWSNAHRAKNVAESGGDTEKPPRNSEAVQAGAGLKNRRGFSDKSGGVEKSASLWPPATPLVVERTSRKKHCGTGRRYGKAAAKF